MLIWGCVRARLAILELLLFALNTVALSRPIPSLVIALLYSLCIHKSTIQLNISTSLYPWKPGVKHTIVCVCARASSEMTSLDALTYDPSYIVDVIRARPVVNLLHGAR